MITRPLIGGEARFEPMTFSELLLDESQCFEVLNSFISMAEPILFAKHWRDAVPPDQDLLEILRRLRGQTFTSASDARCFFEDNFLPVKLFPNENLRGFVTGYFEPFVASSTEKELDFSYPILARPSDEPKRQSTRSEIDVSLEEYQPIAWVRDPIEAFMIQVQGSAVLEFQNGERQRLVFDGRNGKPYSSIGRVLIERAEISPHLMSIAALKDWVRQAGQSVGQKGRDLLWLNESYVFFRLSPFLESDVGPMGGAGVALKPFVSLATDRTIWPYATPFLISGDLRSVNPDWGRFQRLMLSQDTGTAIRGPARGDIFFGTGEEAGMMASLVRHNVDFVVFLPK